MESSTITTTPDVSATTEIEKMVAHLERRQQNIEEAKRIIEENQHRAEAFCGPVSEARHRIVQARITIDSAEGYFSFIEQLSMSDDVRVSSIAKAALAEVAKRRLSTQEAIV